jgi:hypothetical protein
MRVTNGIPLGSSLLLPLHTGNCVQTLKDVAPDVVDKIVRDLRTCLKFLAPPNWGMTGEEIEVMDPTSLSHFPLDQFLQHYTAQMDEFISSRVYGARFLTGVYTRRYHWFPRLLT